MSARDELIGLMTRYGVPGLLIRVGLDAVLEEHAHELAEKIRQALDHGESMVIQTRVPLHEVLARRIDPEASDG